MGKAFASGGAVGGGGSAVPGRSVVNRVAVGVVHVEEQPMTHLVLQRRLQRAVVGVDRVLPVAQAAVVLVQPATQTGQCPAEVVGFRNVFRQQRTGLPVDVFSAEQLVTGCAHIARLHHRLEQDFALYAQVEVVHVRILDALREDDSGQDRLVRVARIPAVDVAKVLRLCRRTLVPRVAAGSNKGRHFRGILSVVAGGGVERGWPVDNVLGTPWLVNTTACRVERIVGKVPARIRERVVERALVSYAKPAAQRSLAVAKHVPGKTDARSKVIVVASAQSFGWGETTGGRRTTARQLR